MISPRPSKERGHANHGWLDSYHSFSFATYRDPRFMGFRDLRVINEDRVAAAEGFETHPHRDMEILTYVISGALAHKDSMGNGRIIRPGEVQGMSAGTGITHSEFNASDTDPVHFLQIWIKPHTMSVVPSYAEWLPDGREKQGWALAASGDGAQGSIRIHQDARMHVAVCDRAMELPVDIASGRFGWLQVAAGRINAGGESLAAGDGASFAGGDIAVVRAEAGSQLLLFDLI
jgi:hypothetical protein